VPNGWDLELLLRRLVCAEVQVAAFREPDCGGELTAVATADPQSARLLSSIPLALRDVRVSRAVVESRRENQG
jgi:hypothetical protein